MNQKLLIYAGPWAGGVTDRTAIIKASVINGVENAGLELSTDPNFSNTVYFPCASIWADQTGKFKRKLITYSLSNLDPHQQYHYRLVLNDSVQELAGAFRTFPQQGQRHDFRIVFAACSGNARFTNLDYPKPEAYVAIRKEPDISLFLHLGDLHYANIRKPEIAPRLEKYDWMLQRKEPGDLFRSHAMAYVWDDHDFLGDDIDGGDPKYKAAAVYARDAYDLYVPHYPFPDHGREGIYQSFVLGKVLFIITDNRFNKLGHGSDTSKRSLLGIHQREWLKSQLLEGKKYDLIVWCNSLPWVGKAHPREVYWAGYSDERTNLSLFIAENQVRNLCMLSGDAHMLAIDDGTNTGFTENGKGGFPLFHAAAIESRPTRKGGIYSKGTKDGKPGPGIAGTGQYGVMEVKYPPASDSPRVFWTGKRVKKRSRDPEDFQSQILLSHEFIASSATIL